MSTDLENKLRDLVDNKSFVYQEWRGKFKKMKLASATEKGEIGEDFLKALLEDSGYTEIDVVEGRRGDYDVSVTYKGKTLKFEVKVATQDTSSNFQFNGIRYDTKYTHLFCLGIGPNEARFLVIPIGDLHTSKHHLVNMAKGSNASFKLTKKSSDLMPLGDFKSEIAKLLPNT